VASSDIDILFDGELIAGIVLDPIQDSFPWYTGTLVDGPALAKYRSFVDAYFEVDLEFDYCPHHPDEGPFDSSELARYIAALSSLVDPGTAGAIEPELREHWLARWIEADVAVVSAYIAFLDWRRWRAVDRDDQIVAAIPLPPALDVASGRFDFRI
jgi:hypothetical protein